MQRTHNKMTIKRIVDACMTALLLCLMAYQVTGEVAHEWIGIGMTVLVIISHCSYVLPRGNWPVLLSAQQNT